MVPIALDRRCRTEDRGGVRLRRRPRQLVGKSLTNFFVIVIVRQLRHLDEHGDRRRQPCPLRHLEGRLDGQAARAAEPLERARERHVARHGHQHPLRPLRRQPVRHPRGEQHRLRLREHLRDLRLHPLEEGQAGVAATDQARVVLGADRARPLRRVHRLRGRRRRLVPDRRRRGPCTAAPRRRSSASASSSISLLLFLFRRIVQDKETPHWREETPTMPDAHVAALLEEEMQPV